MIRILGTMVVAAAAATAGLTAQQRRPLPAFAVSGESGPVVASDRLNGAGRWVLIYAAPAATTTDRLLPLMQEWGDPARMVIITPAQPAAIDRDIRTRFRGLPAPAVYADPDGSAARALQITSVPALFGVEGGAVDWVVQGVLNDPGMVESLIRNWLAGR